MPELVGFQTMVILDPNDRVASKTFKSDIFLQSGWYGGIKPVGQCECLATSWYGTADQWQDDHLKCRFSWSPLMRNIILAFFALVFGSIPVCCYVCCYLTKKGKITWGPTPEPLGQRNPQWRVDYNSMVPNSPSKFLGDQL